MSARPPGLADDVCVRGHAMTPENILVQKGRSRPACRMCNQVALRLRREATALAEGRILAPPRVHTRAGASLEERVAFYTERSDAGCWMWTGPTHASGYGALHVDGRHVGAHRAAYEIHVGPIPEGMTVDHLCFVPACVNPDHLQLLTHSENCRRQRKNIAETCHNGHPWTEENTYYSGPKRYRRCRACHRAKARVTYWQRKEAAA